jgi:DNA invertase Pin-like site-specific DNA recombinase
MFITVAVYMQVDRFFPPEIIQRTAIQKWLAQNKIAHSSVQWFIDREAKTEFKQMSEDIKNGSIQTVVMYSLEQEGKAHLLFWSDYNRSTV